MIRLKPYYERDGGQQLLDCYLHMVADVVPFFRGDVLDGLPEGTLGKPRQRREAYQKLLEKLDPSIKDGTDELSQKRVDALVAKRLIWKYSQKLHDYLYADCPYDGHVNRENLRKLLTVWLPGGQLPKELEFKGRTGGKALLDHVFRYEAFSGHKDLYSFVRSLGAEVCPYCNRQYTTTISEEDRRTRPQLDHFKNKKDYPYLALSINNLVPSCGVCNLLKRDKDEDLLYPYEEGLGDAFRFRTTIPEQRITTVLTGARIAPEDFELTLEQNQVGLDKALAARAKNSIEALALEPLYDSHKDYVADLYFQRYILTDKLIHDVYMQFRPLFSSEKEVRAALLSMNIDRECWGDRPLSKLTHDIQEEIEALYAKIHS